MRHLCAILLLSSLMLVLTGCGEDAQPVAEEQPLLIRAPLVASQMPDYRPNPIPIVAMDKNEPERLRKLVERLTTTLHDDVKWEIIEYGPRAIDVLIQGVRRGEETQLRKDTTRAFIQHDMGDACDGLLREMIVFHSNYAGEDLPKRGDFGGWMAWWSKHKGETLFYSPSEAEKRTGMAVARQ